VSVYEASTSQVERIKETIDLNRVFDQINLNHSIIGFYSENSTKRYREMGTAERIEPNELPECDILELDCEGAEEETLKNISFAPRVIIVETHEFIGVHASDIIYFKRKRLQNST